MQCDYDIGNLNPNLPTRCSGGQKFDTQHAVQGKKGEFETLRHKKLRGITGAFCEEVCHDVVIKLILQSVTDCSLIPLTTNTNDGSRSYVKAKSF